MRHAIVLFSGGMDSTIALYWALRNYDVVDGLAIDYGQRHRNEVKAARTIWELAQHQLLDVHPRNLTVVELPRAVFAGTASILGRDTDVQKYADVIEAAKHNTSDNSYVPLRNAIFLAIAANHLLVASPDGGTIVTGFRGRAEGPGGGFPDGSPEFADACTFAFSIGAFGQPLSAKKQVLVWDPLNRPGRTRKDALKLAASLPGCWEALSHSLTCFEGDEVPCGACLPCLRRAEGFHEYGARDPLVERIELEVSLKETQGI